MAVALFGAGCVHTDLIGRFSDPSLVRLNGLNDMPLELIVTDRRHAPKVGTQFLLMILPFGSVALHDGRTVLGDHMLNELALRGYRVLEAGRLEARPYDTLTVHLDRLSVSAYDLLLTRIVRAEVRISGTRDRPDGSSYSSGEITGASSAMRSYGFAMQLEREMHAAFAAAVDELLARVNLAEARR